MDLHLWLHWKTTGAFCSRLLSIASACLSAPEENRPHPSYARSSRALRSRTLDLSAYPLHMRSLLEPQKHRWRQSPGRRQQHQARPAPGSRGITELRITASVKASRSAEDRLRLSPECTTWLLPACPLPPSPRRGHTLRLHRTAVHTATQPWLVTGRRSPAWSTMAVMVAIANLNWKREKEGPMRLGTPRVNPHTPFRPLTPWPWQAIRQSSSSRKVVFWQRLSWHTYGQCGHWAVRGSEALTHGSQVAARGWVGRAHHSRSTLGACLYQAQVRQVQLGTGQHGSSPASHLAAAQVYSGVHRNRVRHQCALFPALALQFPTPRIPREKRR